MSEKSSSIHYINYLDLDKILNAQNTVSGKGNAAAHEEMLFIIIHQTYELWFKQIIHELESIISMFKTDTIDESSLSTVVKRVSRINTIMDTLINQIEILETMTAIEFLDFRNHLSPASGFQSHQFRKIEVMTGLKIKNRHEFGGCPYHDQFENNKKSEILNLEKNESLFDLLEKWLERIPFLKINEFDFIQKYDEAVNKMIGKEIQSLESSKHIEDKEREIRIKMINENRKYFSQILNEENHKIAIKNGETSLSYKATMSALLINLYHEEPILHMPYKLIQKLIEFDHKIATWRFRHMQMVEKMLGKKVGTGGSSGQGYLKNTVEKHKIFTDLCNISTLLISKTHLPELSESLKQSLGFHYTK
ncbi:MAG: hypothetical protein CMP51_04145 [Flavobacteriales bacterium]|nr:hypothetical protein [Flavobacteriales bacterium]|tara:strand:- start:435 stop:1526 length:1092 start_codon:yes stop_codon:yes gene_type:complete